MAPYTTAEQLDAAHSTLHKTFKSGKTKSIAWRKWQLKQTYWMIEDNEDAITKALHADLHRHDFESFFIEIQTMKKDVLTYIDHVDQWAAGCKQTILLAKAIPQLRLRNRTSSTDFEICTDEIPDSGFLFGTLAGARIRKEPLGVGLIIAPWNFPFVLTIAPMIAAVSAGCCVMLKPSEIATASQELLAEIIPRYLDQDAIQVVTGGAKETSLILERRFNHIFYTGSANIARKVSVAAAKHLTPTVLELGGQNACFVTASADINLAAKRIIFSKYLNAGQICLSGNHVFIDPSVHDEFVERASYWIDQFMKDEGKDHAVRIMNERNYDRLVGLLNQTRGKIAHGGTNDKEDKYISPAIITDVTMHDSLMSEEIFGPLLPIIKSDYRQACEFMQKLEHPLGLYIFSTDKKEIDEILSKTSSGGVTINDLMFHALVDNTPFGGVGNSGSGSYGGKYGFEAFTHNRPVVPVPGWFEYLFSFRYPPYDMKHISKVTGQKPNFKRGERIEDQSVGRPMGNKASTLLGTSAKWAAIAVIFAVVDARMGGQPKLLEMLTSVIGGLRSRLPL